MEIDLLPTIAGPDRRAAFRTQNRRPKHERPARRPPGAKSPHEALVFYGGSELQAVRSGEWKLHFAHPYITVDGPTPGRDGKPSKLGEMKPKSITQSGIAGIASRHGYKRGEDRAGACLT
jgi:hypothetical protein